MFCAAESLTHHTCSVRSIGRSGTVDTVLQPAVPRTKSVSPELCDQCTYMQRPYGPRMSLFLVSEVPLYKHVHLYRGASLIRTHPPT